MEAIEISAEEIDGPLYRRWWKVWPFPACCLPCNPVLHPCRAGVSQNKTRFRQDGFDLDLTYVTNRIIVHGFPATGVEHIYRNPRTEVQRLLEKYHKDHFKVYNFANEPGRTYPEDLFEGRVERYPFTDHTCPPLESVVQFCENAKAWLDMDEDNVVSLHCKAGKGRAGIMAACLMVRLGETAQAAVMKFDATRVSDLKGLTVVNQRKWAFMYERLVKEVWGLQNSIGMVPGQDPDLRAPNLRAVCLREISVQLHPKTTAGKSNNGILPKLSCSIYQQEPMGKTLLHRSKMIRLAAEDDEPELVYAAVLPRTAAVQGTFQVTMSAAVGTAATQRNVMDLWWNTTFLRPDGGQHVVELSEMDVAPLKVAARLHQAGARVVLRHTHPHAVSPRRRATLKSIPAGSKVNDSEASTAAGVSERDPLTEQEDDLLQQGGLEERSLVVPQTAPPEGEDNKSPSDSKICGTPGGDDSPGDASKRDGKGSEADTVAVESDDPSMANVPKRHPAMGNCSSSGGASGGGSGKPYAPGGPSPALPGPSPAGWASPAWTFDGRGSSCKGDASARAVGDVSWARTRMWASNQGLSSSGISTPAGSGPVKAVGIAADWGSGSRVRRRTGQGMRHDLDPMGASNHSRAGSLVPAGSMAVPTGHSYATRGGNSGSVRSGSGGIDAARDGYYAFPLHRETDSESDDQVAVRASAFAVQSGYGGGRGGPARGRVVQERYAGQGPTLGSSSTRGDQWAMEMETRLAMERRRWEEHQQCLETELDWALAARARAEARSEEDSARVEVLESRLSAWRGEYTVIERDVKQAVGLLEMSLSGLMSAEGALKKWQGQIPPKAFQDIMACLTKGDMPREDPPAGVE